MDSMLRNGNGPSNGQSLPDRLALYKQMDETRHEEFSNLAQAVITLEEKLRNAKADLEDEQMTRRQYRRRAEDADAAAVSETPPLGKPWFLSFATIAPAISSQPRTLILTASVS